MFRTMKIFLLIFCLNLNFVLANNNKFLELFSKGKLKKVNLRQVETYIQGKNYKEAENLLMDNLENKTNYIESLVLMGDISFYKADIVKTRLYYQKALNYSEKKFVNSHIYNKLADTYYDKKDIYQAIKVLKEAFIKDEYNVGTFIRMAVLYQQLDIDNQALENFQEAYNLEPNNVFVNFNLAKINTKNLNYEEAIFYYKKIIDITSNNYFKYELAKIYYLMNNLDSALALMFEVVEKSVDYKYKFLLGEILYKKMEFDKALEAYQKAYFLSNENEDVKVNIYLTLLQLKKMDYAKKVYKKFNFSEETRKKLNTIANLISVG